MTFKTQEAKLREEIEKRNKIHRKEGERLKSVLSDGGWDDTIELEAKLQQLLADKKMIKDSIGDFELIVFDDLGDLEVQQEHFKSELKELLKTLGIQEEI